MEYWAYRSNHRYPGTEIDFGGNYGNAVSQRHPDRSSARHQMSSCDALHYDLVREVVNPSKDQKPEEVASRHQVDPVKFE